MGWLAIAGFGWGWGLVLIAAWSLLMGDKRSSAWQGGWALGGGAILLLGLHMANSRSDLWMALPGLAILAVVLAAMVRSEREQRQ